MDTVQLVDEFAEIKAKMDKLNERLAELKEDALATGMKVLKGSQHKLTVAYTAESMIADYKGLVAKLQIEVPDEFKKKKEGFSSVTLRGL